MEEDTSNPRTRLPLIEPHLLGDARSRFPHLTGIHIRTREPADAVRDCLSAASTALDPTCSSPVAVATIFAVLAEQRQRQQSQEDEDTRVPTERRRQRVSRALEMDLVLDQALRKRRDAAQFMGETAGKRCVVTRTARIQ